MKRHAGNVKEYAPGTVVTLSDGRKKYVLLALTHFDDKNVASCTLPDYCAAIDSLLMYANDYGQGDVLRIPLIGGGLSRMGSTSEDLLELLVSLIKASSYAYPSEIEIVLSPSVSDSVDYLSIH